MRPNLGCRVCHARAAEACGRLAAEFLKALTPALVRVEVGDVECECECHPDAAARLAELLGWPEEGE